MLGDDQVLQDRHAREQADVLERARNSCPLADAKPVHLLEQKIAVPGMQRHPPYGRLVETGQAIEDGGLAGAVRTDNRRYLAVGGGESHIVHRHEAAEPHRQVFDFEQRLPAAVGALHCIRHGLAGSGSGPPRGCRRMVGSRTASSPRGRQIMISTMPIPNASMR